MGAGVVPAMAAPKHIPRHIVVINVFFDPFSYGGATIVAEQVAHQLIERYGCRITAISVQMRTDLAPYTVIKTEARGVVSYLINLPPDRSYAELYTNPRVVEIVSGLLDTLEPDLVHVHCVQDIGAGVISLARRRGLPVVLSVHDFWWLCERQFMIRQNQRYCAQDPVKIENCRGCVDDMPRARLRQEVLLAEAAQANLITFPSQFARDLSERSGMSAPRLAVWPNGVRQPGPGFFDAQAARRQADPRPVFGFVGGPSQIKGWPLIKAAFEGLADDHAPFAGYLVDGSLDGTWWKGHKLSKMKGDWDIHPRFSQRGMDEFYAKIDVLLFLSQWKETFGLTIREALCRGIRVIQTDSGGTTEYEGADPAHMLKIGDGPAALRAEITRVLAAAHDPAPAHHVTSYAEQADALMALVARLRA